MDPILERAKQRHVSAPLTVKQTIDGCFEARKAELKGDGSAGKWMSPLKNHIVPALGDFPIEQLDQHWIERTLKPIWHEKADAARKAMNRLNLTLKHAAALGLDVDLQATMKARALLGKQRHKVTHIPALPYKEASAFYAWLVTRPSVSALALRFLMLTGCRSGEARFATFDEIEGRVWTIPGERTKTEEEQRIPLTD